MKVIIFEFEGHAAIIGVNPMLDINAEAKKTVPTGLDYWIADEITISETTDPSDAIIEPQMIDFGITVGTDAPDGIGEGAPI